MSSKFKYITLFITIILLYSFTNNSFATIEDDLLEAIKHKNLKEMQRTLREGADPNKIKKKINTQDPDIIKLLLTNDFIKLDICGDFKKSSTYWSLYGLERITSNPDILLNMNYQNLDTENNSEPKFPRILHHIWINTIQGREMPSGNINNIKATKKLFAKSGQPWQHIVWTNDRKLISNSILNDLEQNEIEVREISEISSYFITRDIIEKWINCNNFGSAVDALKFEIIKYCGGVYADLDQIFVRDVEIEIYKYDFLGVGCNNRLKYCIGPYFFAASPNHPILDTLVKLVYDKFYHPPPYLTEDELTKLKNGRYVEWITVESMVHAYYMAANKYGTIDVIYPYYSSYQNLIENQKQTDDKCDSHLEMTATDETSNSAFSALLRYSGCASDIIHSTNERKAQEYWEIINIGDVNAEQHLICVDELKESTWTE